MAELKELGMEAGDIEDLTDLAMMMEKFLTRVPGIEEKIGAESDYTLLDQIKLYLLGLPNDIGPLGFVALHSVLEADDEDIVDVQVGEFTPDQEVAPVDEYLQRKKLLAAEKAAESAAAEEEVTAELIKDILNRKRRAAVEAPESPGLFKSLRNKVVIHMINKLAKLPAGTLGRHSLLRALVGR